jgi:molybdopterin synthase catalytic subunit
MKKHIIMGQYLINSPIFPDIISTHLAKVGSRKDTGGHSVFLGQVRNDILGGKRVAAIDYSAYEPMLNGEADKIVDEIKKEFNDVISLVILHATRACSQAVELIKERLPVWKKEIFEDDSHRWREND